MTDNSGCFLPKKHVGSPCVVCYSAIETSDTETLQENLIRLGRQLEACASEIMLTIESLSDLDVHLDYRANAQRLKTLNDEFNTLMNNLTQVCIKCTGNFKHINTGLHLIGTRATHEANDHDVSRKVGYIQQSAATDC